MAIAHTEKVQKATLKLILDEPFFASKFMSMTFEADESVPTACTNGRFIKYNPTWFDQFDVEYIMGVLAHEVMHVTNMHVLRSIGLDLKRANVAADLSINTILKACGFKLPTSVLLPAQYGLEDDKHFEWYYTHLPEYVKEDKDGGFGGMGSFEPMTNEDGSALSDAQVQDEQAQIELDVQRAAKAVKMCGKLPGAIEEMVLGMMNPVMDWREMLRQFLDKTAKNKWDWNRPSRRFDSIYVPQRRGEELKPIAIYLDQSGSVDNDKQEQFFAELNDILGNSFPCTVHVSVFDTQVLATKSFTHEDYPIEPLRHTCGGTDLKVPFDHADTYPELACCLVFTDLMGPQYETDRKYPTLWVSTVSKHAAGNYLPTYGEIAYL